MECDAAQEVGNFTGISGKDYQKSFSGPLSDADCQKRDGFEVTLKGKEAGYSVAVWTDGKCAYAIDAQDAPMQEDELRSMIEFLSQSME